MLFATESLPAGPPIETKKALILLDFQNDFVSPNGRLPVGNVNSFLSNLTSLVAEFRVKGDVIWVGTEYRQPRSNFSAMTGSHSILLKQFLKGRDCDAEADPLSPSKNPDPCHDREAFLAPTLTMTRHRCCMPGSAGVEYPQDVRAAMDSTHDLIMIKSHYSAFVDTQLLTQLRTRLITELYICGSLSNISVYATVLDAVCHGLQVTIIEDCLGYIDEACHVEAVQQMADSMGAEGVDCQELRDDLAGLLGDVIREEDFANKFQVSLPPPSAKSKSRSSTTQIHEWMSRVEGDNSPTPPSERDRKSAKNSGKAVGGRQDLKARTESSGKSRQPATVEHSPPRKRSTSDVDSLEENRIPKLLHKPSTRRSSDDKAISEQRKQKQKPPVRKRWPSYDAGLRTPIHGMNAVMDRASSVGPSTAPTDTCLEIDQIHGEISPSKSIKDTHSPGQKRKKKLIPNILGPGDKIGLGDCRLCVDLMSSREAHRSFYSCRENIQWQKMYHRSGEVPRLVAVQGDVAEDRSELPIYRHPADESPELLPFDTTVDMLRKSAEKAVGHPLNHVLIQWYRNGEDNISEHSDKTLDIVRGSSIVNLSLGARRTMILRMKKSAIPTADNLKEEEDDGIRPSQRIPLPHNSLFILGEETNQYWLHSIRADKRPVSEKDPAELAFDGERISLTFRRIGTFIDSVRHTIWGQGATSKFKDKDGGARKLLLQGAPEAEQQGEMMIRAFGQENHRSSDWDWDEWYGTGFDVVNFETKTVTVAPKEPETVIDAS
ncbi:hypothetical protein LTR47_009458 [Exophiala xenobiotica]|nr:hypothetical protein LTR41_008585 [Exophiala xenobiotica]KAK5217113.1 hypothetical protein LTR72_010109 [Exophiala xenobiotica]KAK5225396.1 hypothetical protein LTR47_009458 [Exophiala xenobiotica]KAK5281894.1 hypothetical protein LTR40_004133 [Exophiala xenobiotica]KAK5287776.1 hypothetical protein LTR14_009007 [Exophiala xenobiotica]